MGLIKDATLQCTNVWGPKREIFTQPFLSTCKLVLPFIEQFGAGLSIVRSDVQGNIQRLEAVWEANRNQLESITDIAAEEKRRGDHRGSSSCSKGLLWLTRAMHFVVLLCSHLVENEFATFSEAVQDAYSIALKPYHGWLSTTAFSAAMMFVPSRQGFIHRLGPSEEDVMADMRDFVGQFGAVVHALLDWLDMNDLNDPTPV